jgi:hypothetical protein
VATAALVTELVRQAPALDPETIARLLAVLEADGSALALALARVATLVRDGHVDAGIALPALAMAAATLDDPAAGDREREAARYEIETLLPVPGSSRRVALEPDVPLTALSRARRSRP